MSSNNRQQRSQTFSSGTLLSRGGSSKTYRSVRSVVRGDTMAALKEQARKYGVRNLNVKKLNIAGVLKKNRNDTEIPQFIYSMKNLVEMNLYNRSIQTVPDNIGNFPKLERLNLGFNPFRKLPDTIGNLSNLKTLSLEECTNLDNLPTSVTNLTNLTHLDMNNNKKITNLPDNIGCSVSVNSGGFE